MEYSIKNAYTAHIANGRVFLRDSRAVYACDFLREIKPFENYNLLNNVNNVPVFSKFDWATSFFALERDELVAFEKLKENGYICSWAQFPFKIYNDQNKYLCFVERDFGETLVCDLDEN